MKTMNWLYGILMIVEFCLKIFSASHGVCCCHPFTVDSSREKKHIQTKVHFFVLCNDGVSRVDYRGLDKYVALVE